MSSSSCSRACTSKRIPEIFDEQLDRRAEKAG